jgi:hypothetical protein
MAESSTAPAPWHHTTQARRLDSTPISDRCNATALDDDDEEDVQYGKIWDRNGFDPTAPFSIIAYVTAIIAFLAFVGIVLQLFEPPKQRMGPIRIFACIFASLVLRCFWEFFHFCGNDRRKSMRYINRVAMCLQFSGVSFLVMGYIRVLLNLRNTSVDGKGPLRSGRPFVTNQLMRYMTLGANIVLYVLTLSIGAQNGDRSTLYLVNICIISAFSIVMALIILVTSVLLRRELLSANTSQHLNWQQRAQFEVVSRTVFRLSVVLAVCFLLRSAAWLFSGVMYPDDNIGTHKDDHVFYPWLYYVVPELVPDVAIMVVIKPQKYSLTRFCERWCRSYGTDTMNGRVDPQGVLNPVAAGAMKRRITNAPGQSTPSSDQSRGHAGYFDEGGDDVEEDYEFRQSHEFG